MNILTVTLKTTGVMTVAAMLLLSAACGGERKTESKAGETKTAETAVDVANVETETPSLESLLKTAGVTQTQIAEDSPFVGKWYQGSKMYTTEIEFRADGSIVENYHGPDHNERCCVDITYTGRWHTRNDTAFANFDDANKGNMHYYIDSNDSKTLYDQHGGDYARINEETSTTAEQPASRTEQFQEHFNPDINYGTFADPREDEEYRTVYRTVRIGNRTWFAENLNYYTDNSWCYNNADDHCSTTFLSFGYGRLYTWETALTACPPGWRLPSDDDWEDLMRGVGGVIVKVYDEHDGVYVDSWKGAGTKLKSRRGGWEHNGNGTDDFGFSALPGGMRAAWGDTFHHVGRHGNWWSATQLSDDDAESYIWGWSIDPDDSMAKLYRPRNMGLSVRCVRD